MNKKCVVFFILCFTLFCTAQTRVDIISDSLQMNSRIKADAVLNHFDTLRCGPKLLYSTTDEEYYILIRDTKKDRYLEYFVTVDSLDRVDKISTVDGERKTYEQIDSLDPFNLKEYHSGYITVMPKEKSLKGVYTYFVVKDEYGNRYGEYRLTAFTLPPINNELYLFLLKRLAEISHD